MVHPGTLFHRRQRGIPMHSYENRSEIRALRPRAGQVAHFSLWAAFKSPLVIGADPRALRPGLNEGLLPLSLSNSRLYGKSLYKNKRQERMKDCPRLRRGPSAIVPP
jgi:hypothetical protein